MRMASSITKTSQTAWGPWATCLQRWSSSRSSSKSRWNVCICLPGMCVCVCMVFISSSVVKACTHDWWVFLKWAGVNAWVMCLCVCVLHKHMRLRIRARSFIWAREELMFVFEVGDIPDILADWLMALTRQVQGCTNVSVNFPLSALNDGVFVFAVFSEWSSIDLCVVSVYSLRWIIIALISVFLPLARRTGFCNTYPVSERGLNIWANLWVSAKTLYKQFNGHTGLRHVEQA